jgi:transaldolase
MIKIPATVEGIPVIREMISEGRNVNVTLIFSLERYSDVIEAYISGMEALAKSDPTRLSHVASVASFFISRVDVEVDKRLAALGTPEADLLLGTCAIAQAKLAYKLFTTSFTSPRWEALAKLGARVQRPLWASTSTKNPLYPDTLYVDQLIGPSTVNTLPDQTMEAFADHGTVARTIDANIEGAESAWIRLRNFGIDMTEIAAQLEHEGVESFQKSFQELIAALEQKLETL